MAGSPRWISELSDMADEVRDRTIIVKIRSQLHSWSDLDIQSIFSEFGMIEEVKLLSVGGGFHSQVRYQTIYDSEWAYYYYHEGWFVHQNCCEIRVYRADEVVSWNANRIEANEEEKEEESPQLVAQDEPISEKDHSVLVACQLLEEMPRPIISQEVMFLDEIEKMNDDLVDRLDLKVLPLSSVEELYCSESFHEFQVSNMRSFTALSLSKIEYIDWFKILNELPTQKITMMDYIGVLCFDPGGGSFRLIDISIRKWLAEMTFVFGICLYSTAETIDEGEGSSQIRRYEPIVKTEISFQNACHVLDKIPELEDCHFHEELMVMRNALVTKVLSLSTYGLLIEDVARLDVIYFDLGGAEFIFCAQIGQNVCCKLISLDPRGIKLICHLHKLLDETMVFNGAYPYRDEVKNSILSRLADPHEPELHLNCTMSEKYSNIRCFTELLKIRKLFGASLVGIIMKQSVLLALKCDGVKDMRGSIRIRMQGLVFKSDLFTSIICSEILCFDPGGKEIVLASNYLQSCNVLSKKFMVKKEDSLDNITLFSIITVMSFLLLAPAAVFMEGIKFTPTYTQAAGLNVKQLYTKCLVAAAISCTKPAAGIVVNDSHAEIIARRALLRFLYSEIQQRLSIVPYMGIHNGSKRLKSDNVNLHVWLQTDSADLTKYTLAEGWQLHMYVSQLPCGDASQSLPMSLRGSSFVGDVPATSANVINTTRNESYEVSSTRINGEKQSRADQCLGSEKAWAWDHYFFCYNMGGKKNL